MEEDIEGSLRMIIFILIMGAAIIALLGYLGYAVDNAYLDGHTRGYDEGYRHGLKDGRDDKEE